MVKKVKIGIIQSKISKNIQENLVSAIKNVNKSNDSVTGIIFI